MGRPDGLGADAVTDAALLEAVRLAVRAEVEPLRRALEQLRRERDTLTPGQRAVLELLPAVYSPGEAFTSADLVRVADRRFGARAALHDALQAACGLDARRVGMLLRTLAESGATVDNVRLVAMPATDGGSRLWALQGTWGTSTR